MARSSRGVVKKGTSDAVDAEDGPGLGGVGAGGVGAGAPPPAASAGGMARAPKTPPAPSWPLVGLSLAWSPEAAAALPVVSNGEKVLR
jgi:hypothetical protein